MSAVDDVLAAARAGLERVTPAELAGLEGALVVDLRALGLRRATDLAGRFRAWRAAGLPVRAGPTPAIT